jgi:8-oxo-dGTP diphosphatase
MASLGVFAAIFDGANRILLVRQGYGSRRWSTPGGRVKPGESPVAALRRETNEEIACAM